MVRALANVIVRLALCHISRAGSVKGRGAKDGRGSPTLPLGFCGAGIPASTADELRPAPEGRDDGRRPSPVLHSCFGRWIDPGRSPILIRVIIPTSMRDGLSKL